MLHKKRTLLFAFFGGMFLLGACAQPAPLGGDQAPPQAKGGAPQIDPSRCEPDKEWWRSPGPPKRGGTAVMAKTSSTIAHLDPTSGGSAGDRVDQELLVVRGCYVGDLTLTPYLVKSWQVSPDALTWTLRLRDDVKWHNASPVNGRPFNSGDVKFNVDLQLQGGVKRTLWEGVARLDTPDPYTVVLQLKEQDADFGVKLTKTTMLPREVKEQYGDFKTVAIGTGPYMHKDFKPNIEHKLVRNPDYWEMGVDGKPLPYLDGIDYLVFADYSTEVAAMRVGQIDVGNVLGYRKLDWDNIKTANPKLTPWTMLITTPFGVFFNVAQKPWDDVRVRKAVAKAINLDDLIASNSGGVVPTGFIPAFFKDYTLPETKVREKLTQDLEGAKKLLAEAGYKPGDIKDVLKTASTYAQDAEVMQQQLRNIGIETTIDSQGGGFTPVVQFKKFNIAAGVIGGSSFLSYFGHDVITSGSSFNYWNFSDAQVDTLAKAQAKELDSAKRKQLLSQLEERLWETLPFIPTVIRYYFYFYSCRAQNTMFISSNASHNQQFSTHMWLDETGC